MDFFIGNTNPNLKEEKVKEIMVMCAALEVEGKPEKAELKMEDVNVKCLNNIKNAPHPRTKCWQITVPHLWMEMMKKYEFFPRGWSHRTFHHSRGGPKNGDQNKRMRPEAVVTEAVVTKAVVTEEASL